MKVTFHDRTHSKVGNCCRIRNIYIPVSLSCYFLGQSWSMQSPPAPSSNAVRVWNSRLLISHVQRATTKYMKYHQFLKKC